MTFKLFFDNNKIKIFNYLPALISLVTTFFSFDGIWSLFFILSLNTSNSKALVMYDVDWLSKSKKLYDKMFFLRFKTSWSAFFAIFCGLMNVSVGLNMQIFLPEEFFKTESSMLECASTDMLASICSNILSIPLYHYGFVFIYFGIFALIMPILNRTFSLKFKNLFFFSTIVGQVGFFFFMLFANTSSYADRPLWTKYVLFNYLYGDVGLAVTFLNIHFFCLTLSYCLIIFIFLYNLFFKKDKGLSFFSVLKSSFFIFPTFVSTLAMCNNNIYAASVLGSYKLTLEILYDFKDDFSYVYNGRLFFYNGNLEFFYIFSTLVMVFFILGMYLYEDSFKTYKSLMKSIFFVWFFSFLGCFFLCSLFKYTTIVPTFLHMPGSFGFLLFCLFFLMIFSFKYMTLEMLKDFSFICMYMYFNWLFFTMFVMLFFPINQKLDLLFSMSTWPELLKVAFVGSTSVKHISLMFRLLVFWPMMAFYYWYTNHFSEMKLNFKLSGVVFLFYFIGSSTIIAFMVSMLISDLSDPYIFMGLSEVEYFQLNVFESAWRAKAEYGAEMFNWGFTVFVFLMIFRVLYVKMNGTALVKKK